MLHTRSETAAFMVDVWEEPAPSASHAGQDTWLVAPRGDGLRLVAIDGCSLSRPGPGGIDGGTWAAAVVRAALLAGDDGREALRRANRVLHDPTATSARDLPQACAVVGDIDADGLGVVRAGDCEAWQRSAGDWEPLFGREIRTGASQARFRKWETMHPQATADERYDAEVTVWASPESWHTTAVGRFADVKLEERQLGRCNEVVLATDGARLTADRLHDVDRWLQELRRWERNMRPPAAGAKVHDDVVVVRVRRR